MIHSRFELGPHLRAIPRAPRTGAKRPWSGMLWPFLAAVGGPVLLVFSYLSFVAKPQFSTSFGLVIHQQEPAFNLPFGTSLAAFSGASSADADVLVDYLKSSAFAAELDARLDLSSIYSAPGFDPWFALSKSASPEGLTRYLPRMIRPSLDRRSHLVRVEVRAFSAHDAKVMADTVTILAQELFQAMSMAGFEASVPLANSELEDAALLLQQARMDLAAFRGQTQMLDPHLDATGRLSVLTGLQGQMIEARIDLGLLQASAPNEDARVVLATRRLEVIEGLVASERQALSQGMGQRPLTELLGEYERLAAVVDYAGQRYLSAQTAYDALLSRAGQTAKLVLPYAPPTTPSEATYPKTLETTAAVLVLSFLIWAAGSLLVAGLRDRR